MLMHGNLRESWLNDWRLVIIRTKVENWDIDRLNKDLIFQCSDALSIMNIYVEKYISFLE